jgi:hypothetical protein
MAACAEKYKKASRYSKRPNISQPISICGWTAFAIIAALLSAFTLALAWGAIRLGFHISTRLIRERKAWKQITQKLNGEKALKFRQK